MGGSSLAVILILVNWGIVSLSGYEPTTMSGIYAGTFFGLISLAIELAVIGRSLRVFEHNGMQATLQTFVMRLAMVGLLGIWFMRAESGTDAQAFCLSYCSTFFVYMCWLTWRTYNQPAHYEGKREKARRAAKVARLDAARSAA